MIPSFTVAIAFAVLAGIVGVALLISGIRYDSLDEVIEGTVLLLIVWWVIG